MPASLTVGSYAGGYGVEAGSLGQNTYALAASTGAMLGGFPWFSADSVFSTAAVADLYADGNNELISGGDSTAGVAYGQTYANGGHIRILSSAGNAGTGNPGRRARLPVQHDAEHRQLVAGRGPVPRRRRCRHRRRRRELLRRRVRFEQGLRHQHRLRAGLERDAQRATADSPALADVEGNGQLDVVEGTEAGTIYVLNGTNGATIWSAATSGQIIGSPVTADLTGDGYQDVIVPKIYGDRHLRRALGAKLATLGTRRRLRELAAGHRRPRRAHRDHRCRLQLRQRQWGDRALGDRRHGRQRVERERAGRLAAVPPRPPADRGRRDPGPATLEVPCNAPSGGRTATCSPRPTGASSTTGTSRSAARPAAIHLNKPVVATALTQDGGGLLGGRLRRGHVRLRQRRVLRLHGRQAAQRPIVGMAATPDGGGYWLVASDGGIFSFGDAASSAAPAACTSTGPSWGWRRRPSGNGYWLVASDGGIFSYGDATLAFHGSMGGQPLNRPIVGMAADAATGGYWEVASDGGIFSFDAPFWGPPGTSASTRRSSAWRPIGTARAIASWPPTAGIFSYNAAVLRIDGRQAAEQAGGRHGGKLTPTR